MSGKRQRQQCKQLSTVLTLGRAKIEQTKGRDKTMLQKETEYRQGVSGE